MQKNKTKVLTRNKTYGIIISETRKQKFMNSKENKTMKNYMKFENAVVNTYRRGLISFDEAISKLFGYIKCMADMEIIESDRAKEEMNIAVKKLLDSEK